MERRMPCSMARYHVGGERVIRSAIAGSLGRFRFYFFLDMRVWKQTSVPPVISTLARSRTYLLCMERTYVTKKIL